MNDAEHLKSIRKALHLTQEEMAEKLGYSSQEVISAIETKKRQMSEPVRAHLRTIEKHEL
jgi:transcriptional regulator with XRE-family HTH domain